MSSTFITYHQALDIIEKYKSDFSIISKNLEESIGSYLAEDLIADRDFPPFDRVTMDGIAIAYKSFKDGQRLFEIETIAAAGSPQKTLKNPANCIEVMTGAIMPNNVDSVIRYEDIEIKDNKAQINLSTIKEKQNVHFKGVDIPKGTTIVSKGNRISSAEINIAASIGKTTLKIRQLPKAAIFSTGDELVPVAEIPELHQIRRSNVYGIQATLKEWGITADLFHLDDKKAEMVDAISTTLPDYELFIFTGGVSKGKFDYLPEVLEELQIKKHFHKVQQRPGKPFWFGSTNQGKNVFALPGNPVSSFVSTFIYIRFWLYKSLGLNLKLQYVKLKTDVTFKPNLTYFLEAKLESQNDGTIIAEPTKGNGSGDFANLVKTDGFLILPQGKTVFVAGEVYEFIDYRNEKW